MYQGLITLKRLFNDNVVGYLNCKLKSLGCNEFNQNGKILEHILENPRLPLADWEKFKLELTQYSQSLKNIESIDLLNSELCNQIIQAKAFKILLAVFIDLISLPLHKFLGVSYLLKPVSLVLCFGFFDNG
ncbi:hypothetical protein BpHYR1_024428 [Brachionus plicatilis]|uniref:Uncharacterized protein n=1 Tax=Brachionus plicatilis TaxID=10195 RepID=A0A3M7QT57_BRAPC|nr:hypothetical protein BpHYR1_024428 [Brachionus plicatilis]